MSIATEIARISSAKSDILTAIADKGVSTAGAVHIEDCPALINAIETGGGGGNTLYNSAITATSTASATAAYTATQIPVSAKDNVTASPTGIDSAFYQWGPSYYTQTFDWSAVSSLDALVVNIPMNYDVGGYTAFIGTGITFDYASDTAQVSNGYLAIKTGGYDTGVSAVVSRDKWSGLNNFYPSTVYVGFGSYQMGQEYTGSMDNYFTGQTTTGTALPYPGRPVTDYFSATANATANEYIRNLLGSYSARATGSATNGTSTLNISDYGNIGVSISALQTSLSNVLGTGQFNTTYPTTAYSITRSTGSITSGSTGLGL